jgi:hypothetical protein
VALLGTVSAEEKNENSLVYGLITTAVVTI